MDSRTDQEGQALLPAGQRGEQRQHSAEPTQTWHTTAVRVSAALLAVGAVAALALPSNGRSSSSSRRSKLDTTSDATTEGLVEDLTPFNALKGQMAPKPLQTGLTVEDEYSQRFGRQISDGMLADAMPFIIQVHKPTMLTSDAEGEHVWTIDGEEFADGEPQEGPIEVTFTEVGEHTVATEDGQTWNVHVKRVRRELRDLSNADRARFFDAMETIYTVPTEEGRLTYGPKYKSARYFLEKHLFGAADKDCDHWHDDAGIANHHIAFTWEFENALVTVDPSTAVHYWDYTRDSEKEMGAETAHYAREYGEGEGWRSINIFDDEWYGSVDPEAPESTPGQYIVSSGRFAYLSVLKASEYGTSKITNPYGLLRSPWNTNPTPYLMRHSNVLSVLGDGSATFPSCSDFTDELQVGWLGDMLAAINGKLHGSLHLMIGGHWGLPEEILGYITEYYKAPDVFLLLSKFMWRQGYIRLPESCSSDTPSSECVASCPDDIIRGRTAEEIFDQSGVRKLWKNYATNPWSSIVATATDYSKLLEAICRIGYPGELFTSAAPQDPIFWSLHGNVERYLQLARLMKTNGQLSFTEEWGYYHTPIASDTKLVCDWSGVAGMEMPTCKLATCPGHKADDLLPFKNLLKDQDKEFTNQEIYDMLYPTNSELPYVYDSVLYWKGCGKSTIAPSLGSPAVVTDASDRLR